MLEISGKFLDVFHRLDRRSPCYRLSGRFSEITGSECSLFPLEQGGEWLIFIMSKSGIGTITVGLEDTVMGDDEVESVGRLRVTRAPTLLTAAADS